MQRLLLPRMCATGHCYVRVSRDTEMLPVEWDDNAAWKLWLKLRSNKTGMIIYSRRNYGKVVKT